MCICLISSCFVGKKKMVMLMDTSASVICGRGEQLPNPNLGPALLRCGLEKDEGGDRPGLIRSGCYCKSQALLSTGKCSDRAVGIGCRKPPRRLFQCYSTVDLWGVRKICNDEFLSNIQIIGFFRDQINTNSLNIEIESIAGV